MRKTCATQRAIRYQELPQVSAKAKMMPFNPGDVVTLALLGAVDNKRRPAVVVSTRLYHAHRPDVVVAVLTTQIGKATAPTDYLLQDWTQAGLRQPSTFCSYIVTAHHDDMRLISHLQSARLARQSSLLTPFGLAFS